MRSMELVAEVTAKDITDRAKISWLAQHAEEECLNCSGTLKGTVKYWLADGSTLELDEVKYQVVNWTENWQETLADINWEY